MMDIGQKHGKFVVAETIEIILLLDWMNGEEKVSENSNFGTSALDVVSRYVLQKFWIALGFRYNFGHK